MSVSAKSPLHQARDLVAALQPSVGPGKDVTDVQVDEANGLVVFVTSTGKRMGLPVKEFLTLYAPAN